MQKTTENHSFAEHLRRVWDVSRGRCSENHIKSPISCTPPASLGCFRGKVCEKPQIIIHLQHTSGEFVRFPGGGVCSEEKNRKEKEERSRRRREEEDRGAGEAEEEEKQRQKQKRRRTKRKLPAGFISVQVEEAGEAEAISIGRGGGRGGGR